MECGSCGAVIPDDSIFCSECGARQEVSRAGSFSAMGSTSLGGGEVTGGRGFGVVSGEAVRQQREMQQQGMPQGIPADILQNIASGIQQVGPTWLSQRARVQLHDALATGGPASDCQ